MGTFKKVIRGHELYLYNGKGQLIYKRWLNHGYSMVMDVIPYGKDTLVSITDEGIKKNYEHN